MTSRQILKIATTWNSNLFLYFSRVLLLLLLLARYGLLGYTNYIVYSFMIINHTYHIQHIHKTIIMHQYIIITMLQGLEVGGSLLLAKDSKLVSFAWIWGANRLLFDSLSIIDGFCVTCPSSSRHSLLSSAVFCFSLWCAQAPPFDCLFLHVSAIIEPQSVFPPSQRAYRWPIAFFSLEQDRAVFWGIFAFQVDRRELFLPLWARAGFEWRGVDPGGTYWDHAD